MIIITDSLLPMVAFRRLYGMTAMQWLSRLQIMMMQYEISGRPTTDCGNAAAAATAAAATADTTVLSLGHSRWLLILSLVHMTNG